MKNHAIGLMIVAEILVLSLGQNAFGFDCNDRDVMMKHALALRDAGRLRDAAAVLNKVVTCYSASREVRLELAMTLAWDHQYVPALALYSGILNENPRDVAAILGRARVLMWAGRVEESIAVYDKVLADSPGNVEAMRGRGTALRADLRLEQAKQNYLAVLRVVPNDVEAREGIRAIDETTRVDIAGGGGVYIDEAGGKHTIGRVQLGVEFTRLTHVDVEYRSQSASWLTEPFAPKQSIHALRVGAVLRQLDFLVITPGYEVSKAGGVYRHSLSLDLALKLAPTWVVVAGVRPSATAQGNVGLLASAGLQYVLNPSWWAMLQGFDYKGVGGASRAMVATVGGTPLPWLSVRAGVARGFGDHAPTLSFFTQDWVELMMNTRIGVEYEHNNGVAISQRLMVLGGMRL